MKLSDFDYSLPEDLVAQYPRAARDEARLMVIDRRTGRIRHDVFRALGQYLPAATLLVVNDSKVIAARLLGDKPRTGGKVEVLLLRQIDARHFEAMLRPMKKIREGETLVFAGGVTARLVDRARRIVAFERDDILKVLEKIGHVPLPPYIHRPDEEADRRDYQTVYARHPGSVAAPTAGMHFTRAMMRALKKEGHAFAEVTLHVNHGTFKPVEAEDVVSHPMHHEMYRMPPAALEQLSAAKSEGRCVAAVGTTSCRTLEAFARSGKPEGETDIFLYPGAKFMMTDALITNFHLPRSTLLMLVAAFAGLDLMRHAYAEAIREQYRFYSYGDAMIVL